MYRIICSKLLVLIRLVIIVSLAGYSLSNATAAMHGTASAEVRHPVSTPMDHHGSEMDAHGHHGDAAADHDDGARKLVKQDCCNDFCVSMALPIGYDALFGPVVSMIRYIVDDTKAVGQIPVLNRPPNI